MASSNYQLVYRKRFEKVFSHLEKKIQQEIITNIESLLKDPFKLQNVKKVAGTDNGYRLRIGRWRVLYTV